MITARLTPTQRRLLDAIEQGATLSYRGWQQIGVDFGPQDPRNYIAMQSTAVALRDRGLVTMDKHGIRPVAA